MRDCRSTTTAAGGKLLQEQPIGHLRDAGAGQSAAIGLKFLPLAIGTAHGATDREIQHAVPRRPDTAVQAAALVDRFEQVFSAVNGFAVAQQQHAALPQAEMQHLQDAALDVAFDVDQEVATRADVQPAERRILQDVLRGKDDQFPQFLSDAVERIIFFKKPVEPGPA